MSIRKIFAVQCTATTARQLHRTTTTDPMITKHVEIHCRCNKTDILEQTIFHEKTSIK